jgi:hypothetical protein
MSALGGLQVRFEGVDGDVGAGLGVIAPQFAAVEANCVEPLRVFPFAADDAIRKDVRAMQPLDDTDVVADVAWQPGV